MLYARRLAWAVCVLAASGGVAASAWGQEADAGDLFPNVKAYDETVPSPVSKPDRVIEKPPVKAPPKIDVPAPNVPPIGPVHPIEGTEPVQPPVPPAIAAVKPATPELWSPYRERLLGPWMSTDSQARFDKEYMPRVKAAFKGRTTVEDAEVLWKDAQGAQIPGDLRRAIMLHALGLTIQGGSALDVRAAKAREVLPLLQEETLPVAQARADAVTELAFGAMAKASDDLLALVMESQCKLARMQVQAGFPIEAKTSMTVARDAYRYLQAKNDDQRDTVTEAGAWLDRATAALAMAPRLKQILATTPTDASANTQIAVLNLSLYGDVQQAAVLARKSDRKELQALAATVGKARERSPDRPATVAGTIAISRALVDLIEGGMAQAFDRYSIGMLVAARLADLTAGGDLSPEQIEQVHALESRAAAVVAKTTLKSPAFPALAALTGANAKGTPAASQAAAKLVLFVENNGTVVKYVKPTPREMAEALGMERKFIADISKKIDRKLVEVETAHCLVITNFDPAKYAYLRTVVEAAYTAAARQYDFPLNENVFAAKLPVFFLSNTAEYYAFAKATEHESSPTSAGYFSITDDGIGYISIRQYSAREMVGASLDATQVSESTLAWNMIVAFSKHYRTNKQLPNWLMDGLAARMAESLYPDAARPKAVRRFAAAGKTVDELLKSTRYNYDDQTVCMTLVNMLIAKDYKAFKELINKIKDGSEPEAALQETFKWNYADLSQAWKPWVARNLGAGK